MSEAPAPIVQTKNGALRGKFMVSRNENTYTAFLGIRYGVIPSRFASPVPSPLWKGTKDATEFGPACSHYKLRTRTIIGDEDCLFLNVYTPKADSEKRAVLVYIHGGGLVIGSGDPYGAKYLTDEDIVLVTLNYRLGMLGFLNLGVEAAGGNMGLKDQVLALKWVQENISAFGGDPEKVTVSGESAGAISVTALLLSPAASGLFRSAVAMSGSVLMSCSYEKSTKQKAFQAAERLQGPWDTAEEVVATLQKKSVAEILEVQQSFWEWYRDPTIPFPFTLEVQTDKNFTAVVSDSPRNLLNAGKIHRVPLLVTTCKEEGILLRASDVIRNSELLRELNEDWYHVAPIAFQLRDNPVFQGRDIQEIAPKIRTFYFSDQEITPAHETELTNLYTDSWYLTGIRDFVLGASKFAPVYTAVITHKRQDFSILGIPELLGKVTAHTEELQYLFSEAFPELVHADDIQFSKGFVRMISSFVKTGVPEVTLGEAPKFASVTKQESETGELNWLELNLQPKLLINPFKERMTFWDDLYKNK